jgi:hypothetical protein
MPILAVLDEAAHGSLDDSLKTLYVQNTEDKKFYLDISPDEAGKVAFNLQKQLDNKKTELTNVHKEKNELKKTVDTFSTLGKSADEIKAALEANRPEEVTKLVSDYEAKIKTLSESFEEPIRTAKERAEKLEAQYRKTLQESAVSKLRNQFDLNDAADHVLKDFIQVVPAAEGSDDYVVQVFENGQPALVAGQPMKPDQLITSWREQKKYSGIFNAGDGGGAGQGGRQISVNGGSVITIPREASKTNPALYQQAKEQAAKTGAQIQFTD